MMEGFAGAAQAPDQRTRRVAAPRGQPLLRAGSGIGLEAPRGSRRCGRRQRRGPWCVPVEGLLGLARDLSRRPWMASCFGSVHFTPLNPNPTPNQASPRCRNAGQSSGWPPRQFRTAAVLPAPAVPLPWIRVWRGLGTIRCLSDASSAPRGLVGRL